MIFHLAGVVSGEAEADFEKGYRVNLDGTRALLEAIRRRRRLQPESRLHLVDRGLRRAVPDAHSGRLPSHAAHLLRRAEGDQRIAARRLHPPRHPRRRRHPPADDLRAAGQAEQGGVGFLLRHHPRAAGRARRRYCRSPTPCATRTPARARRSASSFTPPGCRANSSVRASTSPCRACAAPSPSRSSRCARIAGAKVAARIRREPDELVMRIVAGWSERIDAKRARELGFKVEVVIRRYRPRPYRRRVGR